MKYENIKRIVSTQLYFMQDRMKEPMIDSNMFQYHETPQKEMDFITNAHNILPMYFEQNFPD